MRHPSHRRKPVRSPLGILRQPPANMQRQLRSSEPASLRLPTTSSPVSPRAAVQFPALIRTPTLRRNRSPPPDAPAPGHTTPGIRMFTICCHIQDASPTIGTTSGPAEPAQHRWPERLSEPPCSVRTTATHHSEHRLSPAAGGWCHAVEKGSGAVPDMPLLFEVQEQARQQGGGGDPP